MSIGSLKLKQTIEVPRCRICDGLGSILWSLLSWIVQRPGILCVLSLWGSMVGNHVLVTTYLFMHESEMALGTPVRMLPVDGRLIRWGFEFLPKVRQKCLKISVLAQVFGHGRYLATTSWVEMLGLFVALFDP